jgi:hypothetical protein
MRKIHKEALDVDDAPPDDDSVLDSNGCNGHGCRPCPFCGATDVHSGTVQIISKGKPDPAVKCSPLRLLRSLGSNTKDRDDALE